jgi:hypothetical protein
MSQARGLTAAVGHVFAVVNSITPSGTARVVHQGPSRVHTPRRLAAPAATRHAATVARHASVLRHTVPVPVLCYQAGPPENGDCQVK